MVWWKRGPFHDAVIDPTLPSDALSSFQTTRIVDVFGEGEIEGFPSAAGYTKGTTNYNNAALKDVYLNNTQVIKQAANVASLSDSDYNFQDVGFDPRFGTSSQTYIAGIPDVETEVTVGALVEYGTPISRTVTNAAVTGLRITIGVPSLQKFEADGNVSGTSTYVTIKITENNGTVRTVTTNNAITGRTSTPYFRDYRVELNVTLSFPIVISVHRLAADNTDPTITDAFYFSSYTEIIDQQRAYPNTAHAMLTFNAKQFQSIPTRMYKLRGILCSIPSNGTVDSTTGAISYSGSWNGVFKTDKAWTTDPAFILFELLTNERWGLGSHISASQLSKYDFYSVSQYCGASVDDGKGGTEPRFAINGVLQQQQDAYRVINDLCSVMRCMPYWSAGSLTISQDSPKDASYLFTLANVGQGGFTYAGSSIKSRHTVVNVGYFDMETREVDYEEVVDTAAQTKYGSIIKQVRGFCCTSRGQAARLGRWILYTETHESELISFTTGLDAGVLVRPGDVIEVSDPVKAGVRRGGRINTATTTAITVDDTAATDLSTTNNPTLSVILSDGSVETKTVSGIVGAVITVSSAFSSAPNANSIWILQNDTVQTTQWRVVTVTEEDGVQYSITALPYNSGKYSYVEDGSTLPTRNVTVINAQPNAPTNLQASEKFYEENNQAKVKIIVSWQAVQGVTDYQIQWRKDNNNFTIDTVKRADYEILDTTAGSYEIRVFSLNPLGRASNQPAVSTYAAIGKTAVPSAPTNLFFEAINANTGRLTWDKTTELDVRLGGRCVFRHSNKTDGTATFSNAVTLIAAKAGSQAEATIPMVEGEVFLAFEDSGGRLSDAVSVVIDLPDPIGALAIQSRREDSDSPPFQGTHSDTYYEEDVDALTLQGTVSFDAVADVDAMVDFDISGAVDSQGTYTFANKLDLGAKFSLDLKRHFVTRGYLPADDFDSIADVDAINNWDGAAVLNVDAKLYMRSTDNDPASGGATWTGWKEFINGTFTGRGFDFKTILTSTNVDENILVDELGYTASLQRRQEQSTGTVASGAGSKTVNFASAFFTGTGSLGGSNAYLPSVGINAMNLASGDYIEMGTVTGSSFVVTFKNSSNAAVDRNFTWSAVGYGKTV